MMYIAAAVSAAVAVVLGVRLLLLKRALRAASAELEEISANLEENRVIKMETQEKDLEVLLAGINQMLREIRREKNTFDRREKEFKKQIENISHDLRTPLTAILGYLKITDLRALSDEDRAGLDAVSRKAEALSRLVEQFYEYSRISSEEYEPEMKEMDMGRLLRETLADSWREIEESGLELSVRIPETSVMAWGERNASERIIRNLVQNGCRYARNILEVGLSGEGNEAVLTFENDVSDFEEEDVQRIFERFYVKDESRNTPGTGLGLSIAQTLAEKMGGRMQAELIDAQRLRFTVCFRRCRNEL